MSNEEVILKMLVNRLEQLLEAHEDLKSKWSAELTEIIHLGKGVIVEATHIISRGPDPTSAGAYEQDYNGSWHLPITREMVELLYNTSYSVDVMGRGVRDDLEERIQSLMDVSAPSDVDDDDYEPDDEPLPTIAQPFTFEPYTITIPEMPNEQA